MMFEGHFSVSVSQEWTFECIYIGCDEDVMTCCSVEWPRDQIWSRGRWSRDHFGHDAGSKMGNTMGSWLRLGATTLEPFSDAG
jgi:hypothetical protein